MYSEFAYSAQMQLILAIVVFFQTFIFLYLISDFILRAYKENARASQKAIFSLIAGTCLYNLWTYGLFFAFGANGFTRLTYLLVTTPNPLFAVAYYFTGVKILKVTPRQSLAYMSKLYMYFVLLKSVNRFLASIAAPNLHPMGAGPYNYLLDAMIQLGVICAGLLLYALVRCALKYRKTHALSANQQVFADIKRERLVFILKAIIVYGTYVVIPLLSDRDIVLHNLLLFIVLLLFMLLSAEFEYNRALAINIANREAHIKALASVLEEANGIRHDIRNILNTFGGYLELGALERLKEYHAATVRKLVPMGVQDLSSRLEENPALVSLLADKAAYAKKSGVTLRFQLHCNLGDFDMDNLDLCRVVGNLADNAIEAAADSKTKRVGILAESKNAHSKLIVVMNATSAHVDVDRIMAPGETTKSGHSGIGLPNVRRLLSNYDNCAFSCAYYEYEFMAYLEIRKRNAPRGQMGI